MKKVMVFCLTLVLMASMTLTAFAATGGFVSSPTSNQAPTIVEFKANDEDCTATLLITPYAEKEELPPALQTLFQEAYTDIKESKNLTELCDALTKIASNKKIKGENLAVTELFDIHVTGCDYHTEHTDFDIVLAPETLKNFVALLHMNKDGEWEVVENAKVTNNGEHLEFSVDEFSPFAIVVDTSAKPSQTGEIDLTPVYIAVMVVSALGIILIIAKSKKQKA